MYKRKFISIQQGTPKTIADELKENQYLYSMQQKQPCIVIYNRRKLSSIYASVAWMTSGYATEGVSTFQHYDLDQLQKEMLALLTQYTRIPKAELDIFTVQDFIVAQIPIEQVEGLAQEIYELYIKFIFNR